jgi:hypothetical protein
VKQRHGCALAWLIALCACGRDPGPAGGGAVGPAGAGENAIRDDRLRAEALRRAAVWSEPPVPVAQADLRSNVAGPDGFRPTDEVACVFQPTDSKGYSPKFECLLPGGETVKVKHGRGSAEVFAEVAASRLLTALGFGADRVYVVAKVRCRGCPPFPYPRFRWLDSLLADRNRSQDFDWVAIERRAPGRPLEGESKQGWDWPELDAIDPGAGGADRAQVEALRLMAVFLNHWDAKAENHRLVCLAEQEAGHARTECARPLAFIHDLGKTFGPKGVHLDKWSESPIWMDPATCRLSMAALPYQGATFGEANISEAGRLFLAKRLGALSEAQIRDLFQGARFPDFKPAGGEAHPLEDWVGAFQRRAREITDRPPCPAIDRRHAQGGLPPV